jgi:hypothetical protein
MRQIVLVLALAAGCAATPDTGYYPPTEAERQRRESNRLAEKERDMREADLRLRTDEKEWRAWYGLLREQGFDHDEAVFKANELMRPVYWP